jgi:hypothetical protein
MNVVLKFCCNEFDLSVSEFVRAYYEGAAVICGACRSHIGHMLGNFDSAAKLIKQAQRGWKMNVSEN